MPQLSHTAGAVAASTLSKQRACSLLKVQGGHTVEFTKKRLLQRSEGNFSGQILQGAFCRGLFGPFSLEKKKERKIHPKSYSKIQIRIWEFRGQNPHCKDLALRVRTYFNNVQTRCIVKGEAQ